MTNKSNKKQKAAQILALILALLMVGSGLIAIIASLL